MGKKDKADKRIERNNDVFADIFNTLLFKEKVIKPQNLKPGETNSLVSSKEGDKERYRDVCKLYENSSLVLVSLGIENQSKKNNLMPVRVMGYDYGEYLSQIVNVESVTLPYLYPSITIVLNFSDTRWGKPISLKECIRYNEKLWPYVNDYKIYVIDMNFLTDKEIAEFSSDLRGIFTVLKDIREGKFEPAKYNFKFKHPADAYNFISTYLKDERLEMAIHNIEDEGKEQMSMCEAFDKLINDGIERGRLSMLKQLLDSNLISIENAAGQMDVTVEEFEKMLEADV